MKTTYPKQKDIKKQYVLFDADGQTLGRLATRIAIKLRGKDKPIFEPSVDTGDYVIVINAAKVKLTGNKRNNKLRITHSMYPGGLKTVTYGELLDTRPQDVIRDAVEGMLPQNYLKKKLMRNLKVYAGDSHPHAAQKPILIKSASR